MFIVCPDPAKYADDDHPGVDQMMCDAAGIIVIGLDGLDEMQFFPGIQFFPSLDGGCQLIIGFGDGHHDHGRKNGNVNNKMAGELFHF